MKNHHYLLFLLTVIVVLFSDSCRKSEFEGVEIQTIPKNLVGGWIMLDTLDSYMYTAKHWDFKNSGVVYELWKGEMGESYAKKHVLAFDYNKKLKMDGLSFEYRVSNDSLFLYYDANHIAFIHDTSAIYEKWIDDININNPEFQINDCNRIISLAWTGSKMWALDTICFNPNELNKYYKAYLLDVQLQSGVVSKKEYVENNIYPCAITYYKNQIYLAISREFRFFNPVSGNYIGGNPNIFIDYMTGLASNDSDLFIYDLPPYGHNFDYGFVTKIGKVYGVYDIAYHDGDMWFVQRNNQILKYSFTQKKVVKTYAIKGIGSAEVICLEFTQDALWIVDSKNKFYKIGFGTI